MADKIKTLKGKMTMFDDNLYTPPQERKRLERLERKRNIITTLCRIIAGFRMLIVAPLFNIGTLAIVVLFFITWSCKDGLSIVSDNLPPLVHTVFNYTVSISIILLALMIFVVYVLTIGKPRGKRGVKAFENAFVSLKILNPRTIAVLLWRKRIKPRSKIFEYVSYVWGISLQDLINNKEKLENALDMTIYEIKHTNEKSQNRISIIAQKGRPTLSKIDTTDPLFMGGD
jgi:hypothetical protein